MIALANAESQFDAAGLSTTSDATDSWRASLEEDKEKIVGFPISPRGFAQNRSVTLALNEWERVLTPGDSILEIHIPGGGNVLYMDGHVQFQKFPGEFPTTRMFAALISMF